MLTSTAAALGRISKDLGCTRSSPSRRPTTASFRRSPPMSGPDRRQPAGPEHCSIRAVLPLASPAER